MEGNAGLKTAIPSNVFVMVHSSTYPLPATNIILLQQASRVEGGIKAMKSLLFGAIPLM